MYGVIMLPKRAIIEHTPFKHAFVIVLNSVVTTISDNLLMSLAINPVNHNQRINDETISFSR